MSALPIDIIVKASALLATAALADAALRRHASAAARHLLWSLAIAALLALPIASSGLPHWQIRIPIEPAQTSTLPAIAAASAGLVANVAAAPAPLLPCGEAELKPCAAAREGGRWRASAVGALALIYSAGVFFLLVRLALEPVALKRLTRAASDVVDPAWRRLLSEAARQHGVERPVRLLQSASDVMPMTFGTRRPTVILPASADEWSAHRRRAVLLHELAHVARHDCLTQTLTAIATAIYWPHPGVWWAARRMRVERELACDDRVLAAGTEPRDYAGHLLEIAHSLGATPAPAIALGMARARQLEHRMLAILDAARNRTSLHRRGITAAVTLSLALFVPMAALRATLVSADPGSRIAGAPDLPDLKVRPTAAQQEVTGTWDLRPTNDPNVVQLNVRAGRSTHGRTVARAQVEALTGAPIPANGPVHFPIRREAGTFTVDGVCRNGNCGGTFGFEANAAFADMLAKRGIGRPTPQDQFALAAADVGTAYLDALAAEGYARPDIQTLVRAAQHGVDLGYLRGMAGLGYRLGTLDPLIVLRDHGVDPEFVRGMAAAGYARLSADDLRRARDHGADPEFAGQLAALGYKSLPLDTLIGARDHGVDPQYVRGLSGLGYSGLSLEALVNARDHGVDPEYVRGMTALGYKGAAVDDLIRMRDHGVDPEYVRGMAALGYKGVSRDDLIRMRDHGVDPEYVRRVQRRNGGQPTIDQLIYRRDRGGDDRD